MPPSGVDGIQSKLIGDWIMSNANDLRKTVSIRLQAARQFAGLTPVELANAVGISRQAIHRIETAAVLPSSELLVKLARATRKTADYLLGLDKE
jgi:DNA-binding XRE family transcriptional regulator